MRDLITVTDLELRTSVLDVDHWQRSFKEQPLVCTLEIRTDVDSEAQQDNLLQDSLNYGTVTKAIEAHVEALRARPETAPALALEVLAEELAKVVLFQANAPNVQLELRRPRALLTADSIGVSIYRDRTHYSHCPRAVPQLEQHVLLDDCDSLARDIFFVRGLRRYIIIGLNPCERVDEQQVVVDLEFFADEHNMRLSNGARAGWAGWRSMVKQLEHHLSTSAPLTIELITTALARMITAPPPASASPPTWDVPRATVRVAKPVALMFAQHPSVQVTRSRSDFYPACSRTRSHSTLAKPALTHVAFIGIGTNIGNRVKNFSDALQRLHELGRGQVNVVDTSFLYESDAMYHEDQDRFLNAAIKVETSLEPLALLEILKQVEASLGRDFTTFRNGPRIIDLDLLLYNDSTFESHASQGESDRWLKIPHQSIQEREFVLRPLVDIAPTHRHPSTSHTLSSHLASLLRTTRSTVHRVLPLSPRAVFPYTRPSAVPCAASADRTLLMSIVNTTPDSFSDGGANATLPVAASSCLSHLSRGADILDIGGMSTRPGAADVTPEEELSRVIPLIETLRAKHRRQEPISVDTFRPVVARAAIEAGATLINDVHGGREDGMLQTMKDLGVPVVLMHSRGDSQTMTQLTDYGTAGVVAGVRQEMEAMVLRALQAGISRWNIILDPGIGFAKAAQQNFTLLRHLDQLFSESTLLREFPVLVGLSRKKFLGPTLDATSRVYATAAGVTASIASGRCEIARVHDTEDIRQAISVADAIYRTPAQEQCTEKESGAC
ncbi:trifunctional dihydropteroate synthetase/dihydrohydroxymethylpterin pyrophosphokinase/dihydroneopterin aldolase FOL1 [Sporobolomyces koalae]|uniref:trifunctional dihydropteroate synthetase/dihydrohydroxymethylpterin pyrophosphokinase/dihydroneopterin aldolase FOL1 n=1 Tax=Sporobolomyces koalae TaxID=500713 RepID=UPI00317151E0